MTWQGLTDDDWPQNRKPSCFQQEMDNLAGALFGRTPAPPAKIDYDVSVDSSDDEPIDYSSIYNTKYNTKKIIPIKPIKPTKKKQWDTKPLTRTERGAFKDIYGLLTQAVDKGYVDVEDEQSIRDIVRNYVRKWWM